MTYGGNPASSSRDRIRFLLQDNSNDALKELLSDTEIDGMLTLQSNALLCAAQCAEVIAAKFGQVLDHTVLSTSVTGNPRAQFFLDLAEKLREQATSGSSASGCIILVGGSTKTQKESLDSDTDATQPNFRLGMDDIDRSVSDWDGEIG